MTSIEAVQAQRDAALAAVHHLYRRLDDGTCDNKLPLLRADQLLGLAGLTVDDARAQWKPHMLELTESLTPTLGAA